MNVPDPYIKVGRLDLARAHIRHKHGTACLCGPTIPDATAGGTNGKAVCAICADVLDEREFRAARKASAAA